MKSLHKKISAVLLAGSIVIGGCLSSGVRADAVSFLVSKEKLEVVKDSNDVRRLGQKLRFRIVRESEKEKEINEWIEKNVKKDKIKGLKERLKGQAKEIKDEQGFKSLKKSGKKMHKVKVGEKYYIILFK